MGLVTKKDFGGQGSCFYACPAPCKSVCWHHGSSFSLALDAPPASTKYVQHLILDWETVCSILTGERCSMLVASRAPPKVFAMGMSHIVNTG